MNMRLYGNLMNRLDERQVAQQEPTVGMDATVISYSDRHAGEIIEVTKNKKGDVRAVIWREFDAKLAPGEQMGSQKWILTKKPQGRQTKFTKRKDGRFVKDGESLRHGLVLVIGLRDHHYDWEF